MSEYDLAVEIRKLLEQYNRATGRTCAVKTYWREATNLCDTKPRWVLGAVRIASEKVDCREATA